jgi:hypothetical protein
MRTLDGSSPAFTKRSVNRSTSRLSDRVVKPTHEGAPSHQDDVQPEGRMILIGQAGMRSVRMEHFEKPIDEILSVATPLVSIDGEEA